MKFSIQDILDNPLVLNKISKSDLHALFSETIISGNLEQVKLFETIPFPKNKEVGVYIFNKKSNSTSYYEDYFNLALKHQKTHIFEYFMSKKENATNTIFLRLASDNNLTMMEYILDNFLPAVIDSSCLICAVNDNFLDQFELLVTHEKTKHLIYDNNYAILKHCCENNKNDFIFVLMHKGKLDLNSDILNWLNGDNYNETIYNYPLKIQSLSNLNEKLSDKLTENKPNNTKLKI